MSIVVIITSSHAQSINKGKSLLKFELEQQIDRIVSQAINEKAFPGCVVYAECQDSILFSKAYGYHTYDSMISVQENHLYDLASVTKMVGATLALMKLYDDQLINLDDPIDKYVDKIGKRVGSVTLRQALAHQGGLFPWIPFHREIRKNNGGFRKRDIANQSSKDHLYRISDSLYLSNDFYKKIKKFIRKSEVKQHPNYTYSGLFFYLVPEMVQLLTGVEYQEYLDKNFYHSLGALTLGFNPMSRFDQSMIIPTEIDTFFRMEPIHGKVHDEGAIMMKGVSGNAGLFGNAHDLAKVMRMLLNGGAYDSIQYLSPHTIDLFTTVQYPNLNNRRGLGFDKPLLVYDSIRSSVAEKASRRSYGHTGFTGTLAWADPENDLLFIFLSNRVYPSRTNTSLYRLNVRPTIHELFYNYLEDVLNQNRSPVLKTN